MHDHGWGLVIDPEILLAVVAQAADQLNGLLLRLVAAERSGCLETVVMGEDACRALYHMLGLLFFGGIQVAMALLQHQCAEDEQHEDGDNENEPQATADGQAA
ncbi:hypothetical protein D9M68_694170 [compost metagenome]